MTAVALDGKVLKTGEGFGLPALMDILDNPSLLGMMDADFSGMSTEQRKEIIAGEYFSVVSRRAGVLSSNLLVQARRSHGTSDWFDHRHHLLNPEKYFTDSWTIVIHDSLVKMPMGARVLDLCSGDGFYAYYFYRHRASEITCIEIGLAQHRQAVRLHSAANITHVNGSVLEYELRENYYDVVTIRGAIEHFSEEAQQVLLKKVRKALKSGGWFCGDTVANPDKNNSKLLNAHEFEWADEKQMRDVLTRVFPLTETMTFVSTKSTALLWQSMKEIAV